MWQRQSDSGNISLAFISQFEINFQFNSPEFNFRYHISQTKTYEDTLRVRTAPTTQGGKKYLGKYSEKKIYKQTPDDKNNVFSVKKYLFNAHL